MVTYTEVELDNNKFYYIEPQSKLFNDSRFDRTIRNLNNMLRGGNPITIVSPERVLNKDEIEEYRIYFCGQAKVRKRNMIYFQIPVIIREVPLNSVLT